ncbi:hypothetical protein HN789_00685 [archaeon]|jgi:hypothetical protein|nr:hypothetical protein [archaeon]MBT4022044.1 hypothetical protein [archaeon]MBT4272657.1 hypothetical protein [archaeon]MBT4461455.1 hypothetical protein [archaeon]MBT4857775.1 hypothetical protein [archaeon]
MTHIHHAVYGETLEHEGLFTVKEFYKSIDQYFQFKGFDKKIQFDEQFDTENGKYFHLKFQYYKRVDANIRLQIRFWIYVYDYNLREIEIEGEKKKIGQGRVSIKIDAFVQTGYNNNVFPDTKPFYFLFRILYEQYFAKPYIDYWKNVDKHIVNEIKTELSSYFNLNKFLYERS